MSGSALRDFESGNGKRSTSSILGAGSGNGKRSTSISGHFGQAGEVLTIRLVADTPDTPEEELDTFLFVIAPDGSLLDSNDDDPSGETFSNSLIEGLVLPVDGTYQIQACSFKDRSAGPYTLIIEVEE